MPCDCETELGALQSAITTLVEAIENIIPALEAQTLTIVEAVEANTVEVKGITERMDASSKKTDATAKRVQEEVANASRR